MKDKKNKVTAMAMATTIAVTTMAPLPTTTVYAQELDKTQIEARVKEENKENGITKVEAPASEKKEEVENNKETSNVENEKTEESTSNKENNENKAEEEKENTEAKDNIEEEKNNSEERDKVENQDNKENTDENTKVEDQEKKEETEIKDSNEKNETLDNAENKSESEKVEKEALEKVEEVEDKELSKVEENKESGEKERAGEVAIDETNFPDEVFRQYVLNKFDKDKNKVLSEDEINAVTSIDVVYMNISNLTGIERFPKLTDLNCNNTEIASLDVSNNTALKNLDCSWTGITSLDVSNNTALKNLDCSWTGITSLDVSNNTALKNLDCNSTEITSLDVSNNTALQTLKCNITGITSLDVSHNIALEYLDCNSTEITSLDVSNNKALTTLYCSDTGIRSLDLIKNTDLYYLNCSDIGITSLDVSQNKALEWLNCSGTEITSLDVSNNTALKNLDCSDTGITSLDVSQNTALKDLNCSGTEITSLDVSQNKALKWLNCSSTGIKSLDVSQNTALIDLECSDTPIINLDIGNNNNLRLSYDANKTKDLTLTSNSFNAKDKLECDVSKIGNIKGATLDTNTGIMTIDSIDTPITYEYDCGTSSNGQAVLNVTLNLKRGDREIKINGDLNKTYDGNSVTLTKSDCTIKEATTYDDVSTVENGDVTFTYYKKNSAGAWEKVQEAGEVGEYKVVANLEKAEYWNEAVGEKEFKISQATNEWKDELLIDGWTYGEVPKEPIASSKFGDVEFTYSNSKDGEFSSTTPTEAGIWYVKAEVIGNNNYTGISDIKEFEIKKAIAPEIVLPNNLSAIQNDLLSTIELPEGWTWVNPNEKVTVNNSGYKARLKVDDKNYDYSKVEDYNKDGHYIERTLKVSVSQGKNEWSVTPSIKGWTYGESENAPVGSANHGEVIFTYSNSPTGKFESTVPTNAGTWYMKATVLETPEYAELSKVIEFEIEKATPTYSIPQDIKATYGQTLKNIKLPKGFSWVDDTQSVGNVGANKFVTTYTLSDTNNYEVVNDIEVTVEVTQATNKWTKELSIEDWTYGEAPKKPTASAQFGDVEFTYSNSENGNFSSDVPTGAGTWYVKAKVIGNDNYTGISDIKEFEIKKAVAPEIVLPNNLSAIQNDLLSTIELPEGWTWVNPNEKVTVNNKGYKARLTVDDKNYDYSKVDGYNSKGHYVERTLTVSVSQGKNEWSVTPSIKGWTYGEKANAPIGSAEHGEVIFTYSNSETGKFESTVPSNAGTWYMKATVLATDEYTALNEIVEFKIEKATPKYEVPNNLTATLGQTLKDIKLPEGFAWVDATQSLGKVGINKFMATYTPKDTLNYNVVENIEITVTVSNLATPEVIEPSNLSAVQNDLLSTVELPEGWTWVNPNEKVTVNNNGYKARLKVDDEKYDYTNVEGYNKDGHYVERTLTVSVSANRNEWSVIPSIKGWTYGEKENAPVGTANHGEVIFTYSNSPTGKFESAIPSNAGTWYMKATVLATDEYTGLNEIIEFTITPKSSEDIKIPEINEDLNIEDLVITVGDKILVNGVDYDITAKQEGNTVTVTITFKGNYTGTITKTYEVEDSGNNKPPIDDDNNNDNNNGDDNNNDNDDNNGDDNNDNDNNGNDNDDSNNNSGNGGSNNNNNGNNNSSNGNNNSENTGKDEVVVKPTLPQTGERNTLGLWGLVLTITGGAITFITGKRTIRKEK